METERIESIDEMLARVPSLAPYAVYPECPKCGHCLGARILGLRWWLRATGNCSQNYHYCPGSAREKFSMPGFQFGADGPRLTVQEAATPCYGFEEHHHLQCGRCHFVWFMAVKP